MDPTKLGKSPGARSKALVRTPTEPFVEADSINHLNAFVDSAGAKVPSTANARNGSGITRQYAMFFEFEGSWDGRARSAKKARKARVASDKAGVEEREG